MEVAGWLSLHACFLFFNIFFSLSLPLSLTLGLLLVGVWRGFFWVTQDNKPFVSVSFPR